jgi:hypothetical protein
MINSEGDEDVNINGTPNLYNVKSNAGVHKTFNINN